MTTEIHREKADSRSFSPVVLTCCYGSGELNAGAGDLLRCRRVSDYEFEFCTEGNGRMVLDGNHVSLRRGDLVFRRPGQTTQCVQQCSSYLIAFDLTGGNSRTDGEIQQDFENPVLDAIPPVFHSSRGERYHMLFESIHREFTGRTTGGELMMKAQVLQIMYLVYRDAAPACFQRDILPASHEAAVRRACRFMEDNFHRKLSLEDISAASGLSAFYFHKIFCKIMHTTPAQYLTGLRIERARELLGRTPLSVDEIAYSCSFENFPYFCVLFKRRTGTTPGEYRRSLERKGS